MKTTLILLAVCSASIVEASSLQYKNEEVGSDVSSGMFTTNVTAPYDNTTEPHKPHGIHVASWNYQYVKPYLITTIFLIVVTISKLGFHKAGALASIVPESCLLVVLGSIVGAFFYGINVDPTKFHLTSELFFLILLPPIILESAYSLHDRVFFNNLGTILLYAVIGTILNCFLLGSTLYGLAIGGAMGPITITLLQCLVFSSLIVAVDPVAVLAIFQEIGVNNVLYFLVFGESLLNDAVTVVIYNTMKTFDQMDSIPPVQIVLGIVSFFSVSLGGLSIGIIVGALSAFLTKYTHDVRVVEPLAIFTFAYGSYIMAELFHFSGIISIIGCGLVQAQYAFHNISMKSLTTITYFSKTISTTSDCVIFMFLGMALVRNNHVWHTGFILWTLLLCLVFRFIVVYSLTFFANFFRVRKIDWEEQFIMAYGGLRGAVAFSLVVMLETKQIPHKELFVTTTLAVVIATVFIQGITIKPLVSLFRIRKSGTKVLSMYQEINYQATDYLMTAIEELIGSKGANRIREWLHDFDKKYLKKWLQRNPTTRKDAIMALHQQMTLQLHYESLHKEGPADNKHESFFYDTDADTDLYPLPEGLDELNESEEEEIEENIVHTIIDTQQEDERKWKRKSAEQMKSIEAAEIRGRSMTLPQMSFRRQLMTRSQQGRSFMRHSHLGQVDNRSKRRSSQLTGEIDVEHLKKIFVKNPNIYRQRHDRNLKRDDEHDLVHQLYEKRRRTLRMASSVYMSPASSIAGPQDYFGRSGSPMSDQPVRRNTLDVIKENETKSKSAAANNNEKSVRRPGGTRGGRNFNKLRKGGSPQPRSPATNRPTELSAMQTVGGTKPSKNMRTPLLATAIPISDQSDIDSDSQQRRHSRPHIVRQDHLPTTPDDIGDTNV